jgi:hypothetical protein
MEERGLLLAENDGFKRRLEEVKAEANLKEAES